MYAASARVHRRSASWLGSGAPQDRARTLAYVSPLPRLRSDRLGHTTCRRRHLSVPEGHALAPARVLVAGSGAMKAWRRSCGAHPGRRQGTRRSRTGLARGREVFSGREAGRAVRGDWRGSYWWSRACGRTAARARRRAPVAAPHHDGGGDAAQGHVTPRHSDRGDDDRRRGRRAGSRPRRRRRACSSHMAAAGTAIRGRPSQRHQARRP
jgi:hypothetical protein